MPPNIDNPLRGSNIIAELSSKESKVPMNEYKDFYPEGIDLRPGSSTHEELKDAILQRARESAEFLKNRHPKWAKIDKMLTVFIDTDEAEERKKETDSRTPVSVVVPELYATLETLLTYMMGVFGTRPLFKFTPTGPEDIISVALLEQQLDLQNEKATSLLNIYRQLSDAFKYGFGVVHCTWEVRTGQRTVVRQLDETGIANPLGPVKDTEDAILYEGNKLINIDPRKYLPDPGVEIYNVQDGEFVGWVGDDSYVNLLRQEQVDGGPLFNVKFLKGMKQGTSVYGPAASNNSEQHPEREADRDTAVRSGSSTTQQVDIVYMYIDLIPKDWNLGDGELPEKWMFAIANDEVIISAHPMNLDHGMFPVTVAAPDAGGHETTPISRLEVVYGYQEVMNFYFNSHVFEVEKFLKNNLVIDPKLVNQKDVKAMNGVIRTRKPNWGRGLNDVIKELKMQDVTANHMNDLGITQGFSRQASGAVDSIQGIQRHSGERVTAEEFSSTKGSALSRLQTAARIVSMQSLRPLAIMQAKHTQQFMTEDTYLRVSGQWQQALELEYGINVESEMETSNGFVPVTPFDLVVDFDVIAQDGSTGGGEFLQDWKELYLMLLQNPEAAANIDSTRVWLHMARIMGVDSAYEFIRKEKPQSMVITPDDEVEAQLNEGSLTPIGDVLE